MARPSQGKERLTPARTIEPEKPPTPVPDSPGATNEAAPSQGSGFFWLLVILVWGGAFLLLWGTEIVGLIYRLLTSSEK